MKSKFFYKSAITSRAWPRRLPGVLLIPPALLVIADLAEGHGYHFNDRLRYCYYVRGSLEETKNWISKAIRRKLIATEISEMNHALELLPKKLNAYILAIKKAREANKANAQVK